MRSYCTIFDKNYLLQGIALYRSLMYHAGEFTLFALCMDSVSYEFLVNVSLPSFVPIEISKLYTPEVLKVREQTTHGQFCWVCQPLICLHVLDCYEVDMVTYLEADSMFFSSPEPIFDELQDSSVSLVPHRFPPKLDQTAVSGKYCVQFNAFRIDEYARKVLAYWKTCCFGYTNSKPFCYPGQTTLNDWTTRFQQVKEISHLGAGVAPWNVMQYKLERTDLGLRVDDLPVIFYHYHEYLRYEDGSYELGNYPLSETVIEYIYKPYINLLADVQQWVLSIDSTFVYRREKATPKTFGQVWCGAIPKNLLGWLLSSKRKIRGTYNVYPERHFFHCKKVEVWRSNGMQ